MASGTINLSKSATSGGYIEAKIVWSAKADVNANASKNVTASIYVRKDHTDMLLTVPTSGTWSYSITIDGYTVTGSVSKEVLLDWVLVGSSVVGSINHSGDGTRSLVISGSVTAPTGTSFSGHTSSGSGRVTFDTIPRASAITSAAETVLGNYCNVKWTPLSSSFRYKLKFSVGSWVGWSTIIYPGSTAVYTYRAIMSLDAAKQIPNSPEGTMTVTLYTYSDSEATTQIGSADAETFKVIVPENTDTQPSVTMSLTPQGDLPSTFAGLYIQGVTKVKASLQGTGKYGASIGSHSFHVGGKSYGYAEGYVSDFLTTSGTQEIAGFAIDSRGFTGSTSLNINVIPYAKPKIQNVSAVRCDKNGALSDSGTYLKITAKRNYWPVVSGTTQKNFCSIDFIVYDEDGSVVQNTTTILEGSNLSTDEVTTGAMVGGKIAPDKPYTVVIRAVDNISTPATATIIVPTEKVYMHRSGTLNSMGLGQYVDKPNTLAVAWDVELNGSLSVGGKEVQDFQTAYAVVDETNDSGAIDRWQCRKYASGVMEAWGQFSRTFNWDGTAPTFYCTNAPTVLLPNDPNFKFSGIDCVSVTPISSGVVFTGLASTTTLTKLVFSGGRLYGGNTALSVTLYVRVIGKM